MCCGATKDPVTLAKFDADSFFLRCTRPMILTALFQLLAITMAETGANGVTLLPGKRGYVGGSPFDSRQRRRFVTFADIIRIVFFEASSQILQVGLKLVKAHFTPMGSKLSECLTDLVSSMSEL